RTRCPSFCYLFATLLLALPSFRVCYSPLRLSAFPLPSLPLPIGLLTLFVHLKLFRPLLVLCFATGRTRLLVWLGLRQRVTRRRKRTANGTDDRFPLTLLRA